MAPKAAATVVATTEVFSGPLPHSQHLAAYNELIPGTAREILGMAKREQTHRHRMQLLEMVYPYLGWLGGTVGLLTSFASAAYLAIQGHADVAGGMLGVPALGAVGLLIGARIKTDDGRRGPEDGAPAVQTKRNTSGRKR